MTVTKMYSKNGIWFLRIRPSERKEFWATHDAKWRGNWLLYVPRNIILRYSKEDDLVLDQFVGGGTTLVEAKLLNRNIIGVDVNDIALEQCKEKTDFVHEGADGKVYIRKGDARHLDFIPDSSIDPYMHPPALCQHHSIQRGYPRGFVSFEGEGLP